MDGSSESDNADKNEHSIINCSFDNISDLNAVTAEQ